MEKKRINEVADTILKKADENELPYIEIGDIDVLTKQYNIKEKSAVDGALMAKRNHVLVSKVRPTRGAVAILDSDYCVSNAFVVLQARQSIIPKYLFYTIAYNQYFYAYLGRLEKGTSYPSCRPSDILSYKIPVISKSEQEQMVKTLDKADSLRQKRKKQLNLIDNYLKSVFLDMFGDPVRNEKGWETGMIKDYITEKTCNGFFAKNDQYGSDAGIPIIWISDFINKFYANVTDLKRVNATAKNLEKYKVKYGDILFCRSSLNVEGIGKVGIVPKDLNEDIIFECHVIKVSIDVTRIIPEFFRIFSDTPYFRQQIMKNSKTATMTTIGQDGVVNNKIYVPPIELQNKFADIVEQVEKTKQKMRVSLAEMDNHFNALMQRCLKER